MSAHIILRSILQWHKGKGAIVFIYPVGTYLLSGVIILLLKEKYGNSVAGIEGSLAPGITFILAAIWTYLTRDSYVKDKEGNRKKVNIENSFLSISMKMWAYIFAVTGLIFLAIAAFQYQPRSTVTYFQYGGYGDTNYALLSGKVLQLNKPGTTKDSLLAVGNVDIRIEGSDKGVQTDSNGRFELWSGKGVFNLQVIKEGYQPLHIENYVSDPDRISAITIQLEKGKRAQTFAIQDSADKRLE